MNSPNRIKKSTPKKSTPNGINTRNMSHNHALSDVERVRQAKCIKIAKAREQNIANGNYIAPTNINTDTNAWKVYQKGTKNQDLLDANQTFNNSYDHECARIDGLVFGGKKRRRTKRRNGGKTIKRKYTKRR